MQRIQTNIAELRSKKLVGSFKAERGEVIDWLGDNDASGGGMLFWSFIIEMPGQIHEATIVCRESLAGEQAFNIYGGDDAVAGLVELAREVHRDKKRDENPFAGLLGEFEEIMDEVKRKHGEKTATIVRIAFHASKLTEMMAMVISQADLPDEVRPVMGKMFSRFLSSMIDDAIIVADLAGDDGKIPEGFVKLITSTVDRMHEVEGSVTQRLVDSDGNFR